MQEAKVMRPLATSWMSVICGWIAAIGGAALVAPAVAATLAGRPAVPNDLALAVPVVLGLMIAYLIGGYVAGRMAGYHTSWHGMMAAFFGLLITLIALLLAAAAERGLLAGSGVQSLADVFPGIRQLDLRSLGDTVTFGALLGFLATIFAGWLGGLLAPSRGAEAPARVAVTPSAGSDPLQQRQPAWGKPRFRLLPALGRKGGEQVERKDEEVRESRIEHG